MKHPHRTHWLLALLALATSLACADPPQDNRREPRERRERVERQDNSNRTERAKRPDRSQLIEQRPERPRIRVSLDRAVSMAERRFNARVVRADTRGDDDGVVYVLRLLNDAGRVWTVRVDATTGDMQ